MDNPSIKPEYITKPIQLLAAWLIGLIVVDSAFLTTATKILSPTWAPSVLIIASIVNVPVFLVCIFLLQTKFRPEMQEDTYYSKYLERRYLYPQSHSNAVIDIEQQTQTLAKNIAEELGPEKSIESIREILEDSKINEIANRIATKSRTLWELYLRPQQWHQLVARYQQDHDFKTDNNNLISEGLAIMPTTKYEDLSLTEMGIKIAKRAQELKIEWYREFKDLWESDLMNSIKENV